jgi:hypothetical protein
VRAVTIAGGFVAYYADSGGIDYSIGCSCNVFADDTGYYSFRFTGLNYA